MPLGALTVCTYSVRVYSCGYPLVVCCHGNVRSSGGLHYLQAGIIELSLYRGNINIDYLYIFASVVTMKVHKIIIIVVKMVDVCGCVLNLLII